MEVIFLYVNEQLLNFKLINLGEIECNSSEKVIILCPPATVICYGIRVVLHIHIWLVVIIQGVERASGFDPPF